MGPWFLSDRMMWRLQADHERKHDAGDATITRGLDTRRPITEVLLWHSDKSGRKINDFSKEVGRCEYLIFQHIAEELPK
jgi:hypothetical protein